MVLTLDFSDIVEAVRRHLPEAEAFLAPYRTGTLVTAGSPDRGVLLRSITGLRPEEARSMLEAEGLAVRNGTWSLDGVDGDEGEVGTAPFHVAAVAYQSGDGKPGLWMDASETPLTLAQVLRAMYDEFVGNGEVADVSLEAFIEAANPNVVILTPEDIERFARQKLEC